MKAQHFIGFRFFRPSIFTESETSGDFDIDKRVTQTNATLLKTKNLGSQKLHASVKIKYQSSLENSNNF